MGDASTPEKEHILAILPFPPDDKILGDIRKKHPNVEFEYKQIAFQPGKAIGPGEVSDEIWRRATVIVTLSTLPTDVSLIKNVKLIHFFSAGIDRLASSPIWTDTNIPLTNSSGVHGPQIAEWIIMQLLTSSHKVKTLIEWQKQHLWGKSAELGSLNDYAQQRLGVLGYGAIGRQTARIAQALGMDVLAYTASPRKTPESKRDHGYIVPGTGDEEGLIPSAWYSGLDKASLHNFLKQDIDVLLVAVPLTPETHHFLAAEEFKILGKKNALIVNIARGAIINTDDLIAAVKKSPEEGGLRGAALDVTEPEPLPADSELWDLENVAITPHVSGLGTTYAARSFAILETNLTNLERGKPLINVVDRKKGY